MARKNLLKGLMEGQPKPVAEARVDAARPRYTTGAIGAVSQSIADLKSRSVSDVDPRMIDQAGIQDRLESDDGDLQGLVESIRDYGQQVPVLLRPNPNDPERFQVVYGRRRVAALKILGEPVKALVRVLDDRALIIAQGQENAARKDLSFIEKANFARQMRDAGYDRKTICDALHMDKTLISRMLSVTDRVSIELIEAIGAAPSVGRERWLQLAGKISESSRAKPLVEAALGDTSDARFDAVMAELSTARAPAPPPKPVLAADGSEIGQCSRKPTKMVLTLDIKAADGFDEWLVNNIAHLHSQWQDLRDEEDSKDRAATKEAQKGKT